MERDKERGEVKMIPSTEQCMRLLEEFKVPDNVLRHTFTVNKIAVFLAKKLKQAGEEIDIELLNAASLLHDLDKMHTLGDKIKIHGVLAKGWLEKKGYPKIGVAVERHTLQKVITVKDPSWEEKLLTYADNRVTHNKIVDLKERFDDVDKRYPGELREEHHSFSFQAEKEIFEKIDLKPEDLNSL